MNQWAKNSKGELSEEMENLFKKKAEVEQNLVKLEKQIFALETSYLEDTAQVGNLLRGWGELLNNNTNNSKTNSKKKEENERVRSYVFIVISDCCEE